jgi:hypothetical protein
MKAMLAMFAGAAFIVAGHTAQAQEGQLASEIRCLASISMVMKTKPKPEERTALTAMAVHYLGRIDVRDPTLDVAGALKQVASQNDEAGWQAVFGDCALRFAARMRSFAAVLTAAP